MYGAAAAHVLLVVVDVGGGTNLVLTDVLVSQLCECSIPRRRDNSVSDDNASDDDDCIGMPNCSQTRACFHRLARVISFNDAATNRLSTSRE